MTDPLGQSQVLPYLRELSKHGYEFHLISFEKDDRFRLHGNHIKSICKDAGIIWHPQDYHREGGIRKTLRQIKRMKKVVNYLHTKHQFDITHCRSYISALAGLELKQKFGVKMIFDMRGFWADERVDGGLWNQGNWLYRMIYSYFKKKELQFLNQSDYTISLTENGKSEILSWKGIKDQMKIEVIPCCADLHLFDPSATHNDKLAELRNDLMIQEHDYVLGYIGSIGTWYMLPEMIAYFKELSKSIPSSKFVFITTEREQTILDEAIRQDVDVNNIRVTSCLHKDVPQFIALFNASIFFIKPAYSKKASSPTKQGELMAMGIPIVCNSEVGDTDRIVNTYHSGVIVKEFNIENYKDALIHHFKFDKSAIIAGAQEYFSLEEGVKRYLRVYENVNGETNSDHSSVPA